MDPHDTTNIRTFAQSCSANGQSYSMAVLIGSNVTYHQKGSMAFLRQEAPDIYRLDEVPTVSDDDLFQLFIPDLPEMAEARAVEGQTTLQDIVEMKEWGAAQTGVIPNEASRAETALLFKSGGDMDNWTVGLDRVFRMMAGQRPGVDADVTPKKLKQIFGQYGVAYLNSSYQATTGDSHIDNPTLGWSERTHCRHWRQRSIGKILFA
ncbi:hypothetical protein [Roseovarius sp. D0-M9]|uniref:hypothetical protein n=1 Tax=Roseovarius sp. D0-M9 TaxID=3127117 RepID=UPI0030102C3A